MDTPDQLDVQTRRLIAETFKLEAEARKMEAERRKSELEADTLHRWRYFAIPAGFAALIGAVAAAVTAAILK